jgi:hypothetical protein
LKLADVLLQDKDEGEGPLAQDLECLPQAHVVACDGAAHAAKGLPVKRVDDDDPVSHQAQRQGETEHGWKRDETIWARRLLLEPLYRYAKGVCCAQPVVSSHAQSPDAGLRIARCVASGRQRRS